MSFWRILFTLECLCVCISNFTSNVLVSFIMYPILYVSNFHMSETMTVPSVSDAFSMACIWGRDCGIRKKPSFAHILQQTFITRDTRSDSVPKRWNVRRNFYLHLTPHPHSFALWFIQGLQNVHERNKLQLSHFFLSLPTPLSRADSVTKP